MVGNVAAKGVVSTHVFALLLLLACANPSQTIDATVQAEVAVALEGEGTKQTAKAIRAQPTMEESATPTPRPTAMPTPRPTATPTAVPSEPLFDYLKLLPQAEPKPNWQIAVERWKSLEWFEQICASGEVFQKSSGLYPYSVPGKGTVTSVRTYTEPFPRAKFTPLTSISGTLRFYRSDGQRAYKQFVPGVYEFRASTFATFGVTCMLLDKHVDLQASCYVDGCLENHEFKIFSDQLALVLVYNRDDSQVILQMRCADGASECPAGRISMVSLQRPTQGEMINASQ